jgi:predicted dehydrogenase
MPAEVKPPIKVGVLSFAMYHANFWTPAIQESEVATLIGIWDDDRERGADAAERFGTQYWQDLERLLEACDAVTITSETLRHVDLVERAAAHGCHILCEKPITTTLDDCNRVERAVTAADVWFMQSYPKRFDPVNHELKRLVDDGELGKITFMRVRHGHLYGLLAGDQHSGWTEDPLQSGGGALLDEGCHGADLIRWIVGEPDAVMARISHQALGHDVEDFGIAVYHYDDGPTCELSTSVAFVAGDNSVEVWGTEGVAVISGVDLASRDVTSSGYLKVCRMTDAFRSDPTLRQWQISDIVPGFKSTPAFHQQNPIAFLNALAANQAPPVTIEDGYRSLQMILCAYESARTGMTVRIPQRPDGRT